MNNKKILFFLLPFFFSLQLHSFWRPIFFTRKKYNSSKKIYNVKIKKPYHSNNSFFTTITSFISHKKNSVNLADIVCKVIDSEQSQIKLAMYYLTNKKISNSLIAAKNRGVDITIIVDKNANNHRYSQTKNLAKSGIKILSPELEGVMHLKTMLLFNNNFFTNKKVPIRVGGSFNFTYNGECLNIESLDIIDHEETFNQHNLEFELIKKHSYQVD